MGLPTVAQPKSSLPEMITDGSNGRLIDETDLPAWGQAFRHYCALSLAERRANAVRIRAEAVNKYSWATIGAQYSKVYDQMLGTP
jgi:glycosyltransferase involved in cell wall biosynthesis